MTRSELIAVLREIHFTPLERKVLTLLCDGGRYDMETVRQAAYPGDAVAENKNLSACITLLRAKLRELQHTILSEYTNGVLYYQYIIFTTITSDNGRMRKGGEAV